MKSRIRHSAAPLITTIQKLCSEDLAKENDFLRQENRILHSKMGKQIPSTEADPHRLVRYSMRIRDLDPRQPMTNNATPSQFLVCPGVCRPTLLPTGIGC